MVKDMDEEFVIIPTVINIQVNGRVTRNMAMGLIFTIKEKPMKVCGVKV